MSEISQKAGRWFCAIPMRYSDGAGFWDRDGGLVCQGFRCLGMDSKFVALGEPGSRQDVPLILCNLDQMMDSNWWRQWSLEGVVLCAWGLRRYEPIARAIKGAGVKLNLVLDSSGSVHPRVSPRSCFQERYSVERDRKRIFAAGLALLKTMAAAFPAFYAGTIRHLAHGDYLTLPSPLAQERYRRFLVKVNRPDLVPRLRFVPYPVTSDMNFNPAISKQRVIIAVGRWQSFQKGTPVLAGVMQRVLSEQPGYSFRIIGSGAECVRKLINRLDDQCKSRIEIVGTVPHQQLPRYYQECQISLCTSYFESFHIASGEALCCGCSVVGDIRIPSMPYFCSAGSGTLSEDLSVDHLTDALHAEIGAWQRGERDPLAISRTWTGRLYPQHVARRFFDIPD